MVVQKVKGVNEKESEVKCALIIPQPSIEIAKMAEMYIMKGRVEMRSNVIEASSGGNLSCLTDIKRMIQESMKEKGLTPKEARKSLGVKRYEE